MIVLRVLATAAVLLVVASSRPVGASGEPGASGAGEAPRLRVVEAGTESAWVAYGDAPAFGYGISPQTILMKLPPGDAPDPDIDFRDWADWAGDHGVTIARSYPPSRIVGPRWLDLFERSAEDSSRFDLRRFDERYFTRLREACTSFRDRGIFVHFQLWQAVAWKKNWDTCYYNPENNVNSDLSRHAGPGAFVIDPASNPLLVAHQKAYVRRLLDATGDLGNVFYDVMNEIGNGTGVNGKWVEAILDEIEDWERGRGIDVLVGLNDEGLDRDVTGHSLSNPRLDVAFLDLGRWDQHVEARCAHRKPTFGVRNIDWNPETGKRFYFAGEYDLSISPDPTLHDRSRRMYWRMFLAKVQMNAGYADWGRLGYRGSDLADGMASRDFPPVGDLHGWAGTVRGEDRVVESPAARTHVLLLKNDGGGGTDGATVGWLLLEDLPGTVGPPNAGGRLRLEAFREPGIDDSLVVTFRDLGGSSDSLAVIVPEHGDLILDVPPFRSGMVIVLSREGVGPIAAASGPGERSAPLFDPGSPIVVPVKVHANRAVLWAKGHLAGGERHYEWRRRVVGAAEWLELPSIATFFLDDRGLAKGSDYEYSARVLAADGRSGEWSGPALVQPRRPGFMRRLRHLWWRYPAAIGTALTILVGVSAIGLWIGLRLRLRLRPGPRPRRHRSAGRRRRSRRRS